MTAAGRLAATLLAGALIVALAGCDAADDAADGATGPPSSSPGTGPTTPDAPPAAPGVGGPSLRVIPADGTLRVRAEGLPAGQVVEVLPCGAELVRIGGGPADTMCSFNADAGVAVRTSADGSLGATVEPEAFLKINGHEVLCDTGCVLGVVTDGQTVRATAPFELPDGVVVPPAPTLTVESWTYDVRANTGTAVVSGSGFEPGADVDLSQCPAAGDGSGVDGPDCLYEYGTSAVAGPDGTFQVDVAAFPLFQRTDGERADEYVDCAAHPELCAIAAPWVPGERVAVTTLDTAP